MRRTGLLGAVVVRLDVGAVVLGLVTGNTRETAPVKLAAAGIDPALFPFGAFGDEALSRNDLPPRALRRARVWAGHPIAAEDCTVVGDTPADIACARAGGMRVLAVATGWHTAEALAAHQPDHLLPDFTDLERVLPILTA